MKKTPLTAEQRRLAATIKKTLLELGTLSNKEINCVLVGMMISGPLGTGCPAFKVTALRMQIETGPPWDERAWRAINRITTLFPDPIK